MATKAELEAELANLKQELDKSRAATQAAIDDTTAENQSLKQLLADHGVDADTIEGLSQSLLDELKSLQKEKPLTVALAAFALGVVVGRASK